MKKNKIQTVKVSLGTMEGKAVKITKLTNDMGIEHPNKIDEGYIFEGIEMSKPKIGLSYYVISDKKAFATSMITEILEDGILKTLNSTYKLEYV